MSENTNECIQKCDLLSKKSGKKAKKMTCSELLEKIKELTDSERRGWETGTKGLIQRFRDYRGDDDTHHTNILNDQKALRTYLHEYDKKGCGDPPGSSVEVAYRSLPAKVPNEIVNVVKTGAAVGSALGLGYIAYRVIRFLPSLLPPLWETIPVNLAVP
jgi:hypothetical protein